MWTNFILLASLSTIILSHCTEGKINITCRHCLDSEIVTVVPRVAPCCLRHVRQKCGRAAHCDKGLTCRYPYRHAPTGICKVPTARPCNVNGTIFPHGTQFKLDCRTSCFCQNGTYGCASNCPQEQLIIPKNVCDNPQLIDVPGQCCREWVCEPPPLEEIQTCNINSTSWDNCSSDCGGGVTHRESNTNSKCMMMKEMRFCQKESCSGMKTTIQLAKGKHQLRKKHSCKATIRSPPSYLRIGPCSSVRSFRPRQCGACVDTDICCKPVRTATVKIEMQCGSLLVNEENNDIHKILMEYIIPGNDVWDPKDVGEYAQDRGSKETKRVVSNKELSAMFVGDSEIKDIGGHPQGSGFELYDDENNIHFINMEWILKCQCKKEYCEKDDEEEDFIFSDIGDDQDLIIYDKIRDAFVNTTQKPIYTTTDGDSAILDKDDDLIDDQDQNISIPHDDDDDDDDVSITEKDILTSNQYNLIPDKIKSIRDQVALTQDQNLLISDEDSLIKDGDVLVEDVDQDEALIEDQGDLQDEEDNILSDGVEDVVLHRVHRTVRRITRDF